MSIISPEPASRGTAKAEAEADAVASAGTAGADAGFMAVLAEALAAWSGRSGGEQDPDTDETPLEILDGEEEAAVAPATVADELETTPLPPAGGDEAEPEEMAGDQIEGEPEIQAVDALVDAISVSPSAGSAASASSDSPDLDTEALAPTESDDSPSGSSLGETHGRVDAGTPAEPEPDPGEIDVDADASIGGWPEGGHPSDQPSAAVDQQDDAQPLRSDASATGPSLRATEVDTAGRSASRLVSEGPVSPSAAADAEAAPSKAPTPSAQAMFDAELEAQEADEDPWLQVARVVRPLRQLTDGSHRIALQLRPVELGTVHLEVALEDGRLSMRAVTETVAARDAFVGSLPELRAELSRSGVDLGSLDVGEQTMDGEGDHPSSRPAAGGGDRAPGARPAPDAQPSVADAHAPSSGSSTGAGAGRLDLTL